MFRYHDEYDASFKLMPWFQAVKKKERKKIHETKEGHDIVCPDYKFFLSEMNETIQEANIAFLGPSYWPTMAVLPSVSLIGGAVLVPTGGSKVSWNGGKHHNTSILKTTTTTTGMSWHFESFLMPCVASWVEEKIWNFSFFWPSLQLRCSLAYDPPLLKNTMSFFWVCVHLLNSTCSSVRQLTQSPQIKKLALLVQSCDKRAKY